MAAGRIVLPGYMPAEDINSDPVPGAKLYVYTNRTTTLASIYSDEELTTPLANPVSANISGQFVTIWADRGTTAVPVKYSLAVTDSDGASIGSPAVYDDFQPSVDDASAESAEAASTSATAAAAAKTAAETARDEAQAARDTLTAAIAGVDAAVGEAEAASLAAGFYPAALSNVPQGATGHGAITGGSGGTDGTFALAFAGGNFSINPTGTFTVSGGAVTAISITGPGLYVGASPTAPTLSFAASTGLTGASATLTVGVRVTSGNSYWTDHATDTTLAQCVQNVSGTATPISGATFVKTLLAGAVPCTVGGSANVVSMTPTLPVSGVTQEFWGVAAGANTGAMTVAVPGIYSGAATTVVMPNGEACPAGATKTGYPFKVKPTVISGNNRYVLTYPEFERQQSVVKLTWVSGTGNTIVAKVAHPMVKLPADLTGVIFEFKTAGAKPVGSPSLTIRNNADTADLLAATAIRDSDDTTELTDADIWAANETIRVERVASLRLNIVKPNNRITVPIAKVQTGISPTGQVPAIDRPVSARKVGSNMWFVDVRPHDSHYVNGVADRRMSDVVRFVLYDMGTFQGDTYAPALNSIMVRRKGQWVEIANHTFDDLISGIITNNGHVPSTFETVSMSGDYADTANDTNFKLSGIGHGQLEYISWTLIGTTNDASTSNLDVASSDMKAMPIGTTFYGTKLVSTFTCWDESPSAENLAKRVMTMTFQSAATGLCNITVSQDGTDASAAAPWGVRAGGYACMLPARDVTQARGLKVTPASGAITSTGTTLAVNLQDTTQVDLPGTDWNAVEMWDGDRDSVKVRLVNNAGAGYTHWSGAKIDANRVARTAEWFVQNNTWGTKAYDPIYSDVSTKLDLSGSTLNFDFSYLVPLS